MRNVLNQNAIISIETKATSLITERLKEDDGTFTVPIKIEALARSLGIDISWRSLTTRDELAVLTKASEDAPLELVIDGNLPLPVARMTVARAIAVHVLDRVRTDDGPYLASCFGHMRYEPPTDFDMPHVRRLARALLMPRPYTTRLWAHDTPIEKMARIYCVTFEDLGARLDELDLHCTDRN